MLKATRILVDWLTFSVTNLYDPDFVIMEYLGLDPVLFTETGSVLPGFGRGKSFQNICVCYEPRENDKFKGMGVCVSMSGKGCRTFEEMSAYSKDRGDTVGLVSPVWYKLFNRLHIEEGCNVSRIDLACDDMSGALHLQNIVDCIEDGAVNTRIRQTSHIKSKTGKECTGQTIYLGSSKSDFFIRFYDKAKESYRPGQEGFANHWVRVELCMRRASANAFVDLFNNYDHVGKLAAEILSDKVYFVNLDDSNITRCSVCSWWLDFLGALTAVRLVSKGEVVRSLDSVNDWVKYQISPSLSMVYKAKGWFAVKELLDYGAEKMSAKQKAIVADYLALKGDNLGRVGS